MELVINIPAPAAGTRMPELFKGWNCYNNALKGQPLEEAEKIHLLFPEEMKSLDSEFIRGFFMQMAGNIMNKTVIHSPNHQVIEDFQRNI